MGKLAWTFRIGAYLLGLAGLWLYLTGQQAGEPLQARWGIWGIAGSFVCFLATYILTIANRLIKRH